MSTAIAAGLASAGGDRPGREGYFVNPTLVSGLPLGHELTRKELFLPFVAVSKVDSFDAAIDEANAVQYGLAAGLFSENDAEVEEFLDRIEAGVHYVNRRGGATTGAWPGIQSFCGWKSSGSPARVALAPGTCRVSPASRASPCRSASRSRTRKETAAMARVLDYCHISSLTTPSLTPAREAS